MKLPPDFEQQLQQKTEAELSDMLKHKDDYLPEAVEAVTKEFRRRKPAVEGAAPTPSSDAGAVAGAEPAGGTGPAETTDDAQRLEDPSLSLAIVATFRNVVDAGMFKARLEAAGIEACIPEEYTPQIFWYAIPSPLESVTVRVAAKDYEAATAIHADYADTAITAPRPDAADFEKAQGKEEASAEVQGSGTGVEAPGKLCVACRAAIPATAYLCPKCGWTQPDIG